MVPEGELAYIELPAEADAPGMCRRLRHWLYGMRPAASAWEKNYTDRLESIGFVRGLAAPTAFYNAALDCSCVVHGDDFTFLGFDEDLLEIANSMRGWYELKVRGILGEAAGDVKSIAILNRELSWSHESLEYEADRKHAQIIIEEMELTEDSRG